MYIKANLGFFVTNTVIQVLDHYFALFEPIYEQFPRYHLMVLCKMS